MASTRNNHGPNEGDLRWLTWGKRIPGGWRLAPQRLMHHHRHSRLIVKVAP